MAGPHTMKVAASTPAELQAVVEMWEARGWRKTAGFEPRFLADLWVMQLERDERVPGSAAPFARPTQPGNGTQN